LKLQQDGAIDYATRENHNMFRTNYLSRIKGTTNFCKHQIEEANPSLACSNPRLEGQIGTGQDTIEQTNSSSTC
jgi:hypothetical protein